MGATEKQAQLDEMEQEIEELTESPFYTYRQKHGYKVVVGEGNPDARVMFIGEAPGKNEAEQGRPFCGPAGDVLDELLQSIDVPREQVYIGNVLKDRPPDNRDPFPDELELYGPYLDKQLQIIQPEIIATLGRFAMEYIADKFEVAERINTISAVHGTPFRTEASWGNIVILPMYHPAVATYSPSQKGTLQNDFIILQELLEETYDWENRKQAPVRAASETQKASPQTGEHPANDEGSGEQMNIL